MFMGQNDFVWWIGVVEDINDPMLIGRARVRIFGYHPEFKSDVYVDTATNRVATDDLPWAVPILPVSMNNAYGVLRLGEWVIGFFLDGKQAQEPVIIGYLPSAYGTPENYFSKHPVSRNFAFLGLPNGSENNFGPNFSHLLNRFQFHTPGGHFIKMTDNNDNSNIKEFSIAHGTGDMYLRMITDSSGSNAIELKHPSGSKLVFGNDGDVAVYTKWPHSFQTVQFGTPPPRRRRRGCFKSDTLVTMADGTHKKIIDVEIGEYVLSKDGVPNKVRFIEIVDGTYFSALYSPYFDTQPFATIDHPLYFNDNLYSVNPKLTEEYYPWLGKQKNLSPVVVAENKESKVYNLWIDGDGTYIVNGYSTTSIIYDGGMLTKLFEKKLCTKETILSLYEEYTKRDTRLLHGAFLLNYIIGKFDNDTLYKFIGYCANKKYDHILRKLFITFPMRAIIAVVEPTKKLHKWRFIKWRKTS